MHQERLLELKQEIDEAKIKVSELTGQKTALLRQLKEEFGCKNLEEAIKKQEALQESIDVLQSQIEQGIEELEEKYNIE